MFENLSADIIQRARRIKLLIMDVDGVLTDGKIYLRDNSEEIKCFNTLDGHGIKMLHSFGIQTAIITGRDAPSVALRAQYLGIRHYYKGIHNKKSAYVQLRQETGFDESECAFIGDDVIDLPIMVRCGLPVSVPNAHPFTLQHAIYTTNRFGGDGAVRELCDLILFAQGHLQAALDEYVK